MQSRSRFLTKVCAGAVVSLTSLALAAPLLLADSDPAWAEVPEPAYKYVKFDVQLSPEEKGAFVVEIHPGTLSMLAHVFECVCSYNVFGFFLRASGNILVALLGGGMCAASRDGHAPCPVPLLHTSKGF